MPKLKILEASVFSRPIKTRMPFRFGRSTMTEMPILHLRLKVAIDAGRTVAGVSACGIPPLWFDKSAGKTHADNIHDLSLSLRLALDRYLESDAAPVWFLHRMAEPVIRKAAAEMGLNGLTAGFGVALVDAALIDAACRAAGATFHAALKGDLFGYGSDFAGMVPDAPLARIAIRHTVGMADPITAADASEPLNDGLPETLEEVVKEYRAGYYKIKISGDAAASRDRLRRIAGVLDTHAGDYRATLDGNEQFRDMGEFAAFLREATDDPSLRTFWGRTLWIEQPVARGSSLVDSVAAPLKEVSRIKPVIIDESDDSDGSVDLALALGYQGISSKNCKGVFRTLHSFRRIREIQSRRKIGSILTSEDLTNAPIVPLHQDLCVAAALGISHSERNGHHYIIGFDFLSPREREEALREYPSLYKTRAGGNPVLRIEGGGISLSEINRHGFGTLSEPDWESLAGFRLPGFPEVSGNALAWPRPGGFHGLE